MEKRVGYLPIEDHGVIGDLHTAALVGVDGTIDWLCLPRFDAPSVFASILDDEKGGHFKLHPLFYTRSQQLYLPDTNVLLTRFLSPQGVAEVLDFMPIEDTLDKRHSLLRGVRVIRGRWSSRSSVARPSTTLARSTRSPSARPARSSRAQARGWVLRRRCRFGRVRTGAPWRGSPWRKGMSLRSSCKS
jgi:GH15 family glucan-1,4-alpha-glucosidase